MGKERGLSFFILKMQLLSVSPGLKRGPQFLERVDKNEFVSF